MAAQILAAEYRVKTDAYPHGVLGDRLEWAELHLEIGGRDGAEDRRTVRLTPGPGRVYEDVAPRLWDVTGDGAPEVVVVESHQTRGARLAVIGISEGRPTYLAVTPPIGTRFRWLAPVGAADLDGDGAIEIAYVDRPHLARVLRIWRLTGADFTEVATAEGYTNHRIGETFITSGIRDCGTGPEIVTANADWSRIVGAQLVAGEIRRRDLGPFEAAEGLGPVLDCTRP